MASYYNGEKSIIFFTEADGVLIAIMIRRRMMIMIMIVMIMIIIVITVHLFFFFITTLKRSVQRAQWQRY